MLDVANLPQDFCIGYYVPTSLWLDNEPPNRYTDFITVIKGFLYGDMEEAIAEATQLLHETLCGFDAVAVVPSHKQGSNSDTGIYRIATGLAKCSKGKILDATSCLHRINRIEKLATGGDRSLETHLNSIGLKEPGLIHEKRVLLLDDVRCTGNSLKACQQILENAKPRSVHPLAFAQSIHDDMENPESAHVSIDMNIHEVYHREIQGLEYQRDLEQAALSSLYTFAN